jgi:hypothetical protein
MAALILSADNRFPDRCGFQLMESLEDPAIFQQDDIA